MSRGLVVAPVARDLSAEHTNTVLVPGATNGTVQGWDTLDVEYWIALGDAVLTVYSALNTIPNAVKLYLFQVIRYDDTTLDPATARWVRAKNLAVGDFVKVLNGGNPVTRNGSLQAGDRPQEWDLMHHWSGKPMDTLGVPS